MTSGLDADADDPSSPPDRCYDPGAALYARAWVADARFSVGRRLAFPHRTTRHVVEPNLIVEVRRDNLEEIDGPMLKYGLQRMNGSRLYLPLGKRTDQRLWEFVGIAS